MKLTGHIKNVNKIVISDPLYKKDVYCRFEKNISSKQDFDIEITINDYNETYENINIEGYDISVIFYNTNYINSDNLHNYKSISPYIYIKDNKFFFNPEFIKKNEFDIGIDTASISYGINEKAEEICNFAYKEKTIDDIINNTSDDFSLCTGADGIYGDVVSFETLDSIPVLIKTSGYITKDLNYSKEEIKEYLVKQLEIKNIEINYDIDIII